MRWDDLFDDMEAQLDAAEAAQAADAVADLTRSERARVLLVDRLRAAGRSLVSVTVRDGSTVGGVVAGCGPSWVLLEDGARAHLLPTHAVVVVAGLPHTVAPAAGLVARRLGLGHALRALSRDRALVRVRASGVVLVGRVDGVAADHLDLATVHPDSARPTGDVRVVPYACLDAVSEAG